ncbi:ATP-binding protein [Bacteroidota bacterium]
MIEPKIPINENARLKNLKSYSILDSLPEDDYDSLTAIAAEICGTPISLVSLIDSDRQWFKSHHGLAATETPREHAFCAHAINDPNDIFIVQDARKDERFNDNPLVTGDPHVIFYAGIPLIGDENLPLGTLCVIDHEPRILNQSQLDSLKALSNQIMNLLKLRKNKILLEKAIINLEEKNYELERFAYVAAHDLKSPLVGITYLSKLIAEIYSSKIDHEGQEMLELLNSSSSKLGKLISGMLENSRSETMLKEKRINVELDELRNDLMKLFSYEKDLKILSNSTLKNVFTNKTALEQIFINLIANAIKYNDKKSVEIEIGVSENNTHYEFHVQDNGPGIESKHQEKIFIIFHTIAKKDKFGQAGNGIGLSTVRKLVEKSGGKVTVESKKGKGANFIFTIEK